MNPEVHHILEKNNIMKNMLAMARYEENSDRYRKMKIVTGLRNIMPITQSFGIRLKVTMDNNKRRRTWMESSGVCAY